MSREPNWLRRAQVLSSRDQAIAERTVRISYDPEGDYLEVVLDKKPERLRETAGDRLVGRVDDRDNIFAFSVLRDVRRSSTMSAPCRMLKYSLMIGGRQAEQVKAIANAV